MSISEPFIHRPVATTLLTIALGLAASFAGVAGCAPYRVTAMRSGALYPAKPNCAIRFENLNHQEAWGKYEQLGLITISGHDSDEFSPAMKRDVERSACTMGGESVTMNASSTGLFQFIVWRSKG